MRDGSRKGTGGSSGPLARHNAGTLGLQDCQHLRLTQPRTKDGMSVRFSHDSGAASVSGLLVIRKKSQMQTFGWVSKTYQSAIRQTDSNPAKHQGDFGFSDKGAGLLPRHMKERSTPNQP